MNINTGVNRYFGGNNRLLWLLAFTVGGSVLLWLSSAVCRLFGLGDAWISEWLALSSDPLRFITRPWTLLTYTVTHLSVLHLLFNSLWLYWFGMMLSDIGRDKAILTLFIGGGIAGGLIYIGLSLLPGSEYASVLTGDSAAVLSVMTATALYMPDRSVRLFLLGSVRLKWIAIICGALTLLGANGAGLPTMGAHVAGILFAAGYVVYTRRMPKRKPEKAFKKLINEEQRLDHLLDKIRLSGYESLTAKEKIELNYLSSRL